MLHFLRKFREVIIKSGSIRNYLLYGLGEIALVVIGILIALQINTWNTNRLDRSKEYNYLLALKQDLITQKDVLLELLENDEIQSNNIDLILKHYEKNSGFRNMTSIYPMLNELNNRFTFRAISTTFTELNSTGQLHLISDEQLRTQLIEYYQFTDLLEGIVSNNNTNLVDDIYSKSLFPVTLYSLDLISENLLQLCGIDSIPGHFRANERLIRISAELLSNGENDLYLFNLITRRYLVSKIQVLLFNELIENCDTLSNVLQVQIDKFD